MAATLAWPASLGIQAADFPAAALRVQQGLPYQALERFQRQSELPWDALTKALRLPSRTLARRKRSGVLSAAESDRLARLAQLFALASRLFDDRAADAAAWLLAPCRALGGAAPLAVAETEIGAAEVEQLLGRLEQGVFS